MKSTLSLPIAAASSAPQRKSTFVSLRTKLLLTFSLLFLGAFGGSYYWFYTYVTDLASTRIRTDLTNIVQAAAQGVNGDELMALYKEGKPNAAGFSDDPRFTSQLNWLDSVHKIDPRAWPYIYIKGDVDKEVVYVVDLWARYEPGKAAKFQERYISQGKMVNGFDSFYLFAEKPYTDAWGIWVSAYAPIQNSKGELVAAIGVDYQAAYLQEVQSGIQSSVGIGAAVLGALLLILVFLIARALTQPIGRLTSAAKLVGEGRYDQDLSALLHSRVKDEIVLLSEVFVGMAAKIAQREQSLIRKVAELKIEIDEAKRQSQVDEIADSDFFKDLQVKARALRARSH